jgi:hypothetical protein
MPEEPRSTALDPDLLTAEIGLLLDYLSGLPERVLTSPQHGHLPPGCATYDEALARYFPSTRRSVVVKPFRHRTFSFCSNCVTISMPAPSLLPALR